MPEMPIRPHQARSTNSGPKGIRTLLDKLTQPRKTLVCCAGDRTSCKMPLGHLDVLALRRYPGGTSSWKAHESRICGKLPSGRGLLEEAGKGSPGPRISIYKARGAGRSLMPRNSGEHMAGDLAWGSE